MRIFPVLVVFLALSTSAGWAACNQGPADGSYCPPSRLGGDELNNGTTGPADKDDLPLVTDLNQTGENLIDAIIRGKGAHRLGLAHVSVFPGGQDAAKYFFAKLVDAAGAPKNKNVKISGDGINNYICSYIYSDGSVGSSRRQLIGIHYNVHAATKLAWLNVIWNADGALAGQSKYSSYRFIFLDRHSDLVSPKPKNLAGEEYDPNFNGSITAPPTFDTDYCPPAAGQLKDGDSDGGGGEM